MFPKIIFLYLGCAAYLFSLISAKQEFDPTRFTKAAHTVWVRKVPPKTVVVFEPSPDKKNVHFGIAAESTAWVGFGVAPGPNMINADILIGGVDQSGAKYSKDMFSTGNTRPINDTVQNWDIKGITEEEGITEIEFDRMSTTSDAAQDIKFEDKDVYIIWAVGEDDTFNYHKAVRGHLKVNLINPNMGETARAAGEKVSCVQHVLGFLVAISILISHIKA